MCKGSHPALKAPPAANTYSEASLRPKEYHGVSETADMTISKTWSPCVFVADGFLFHVREPYTVVIEE